ncbi:hypothetical protein [Streptomyces olivaceoviridis]
MNRRLPSAVRTAGRMRMTGAHWLLLTAERGAFGRRRAASCCEVLEQILARHPPEASGRSEEDAPAG